MAAISNVKLLVFVLGAPGAGKGTQCERIKEKYGWAHISAGDLLRAEVTRKTPRGLEIEEHIKQGTMVPGSWIIALLRDAMAKDSVSKVLIDGFPREVEQLLQFQEEVMHCNRALFFNVPEEVARQRLKLRSATSGRVDDNDETIRNRFVVFRQESMPVIDKLAELGKVAEIDASGSPDDVFAATSVVIEQLEQQLQLAQEAVPAAAATTASEAAEAEQSTAVVETAAAQEAAAAVAPSAEASEAAAPAAELAAAAYGTPAAEEAAGATTGAAAAEPAAAGELAGVAAATGAVAATGIVAGAAMGTAGTDASPQDAEAAGTAALATTADGAAIPAAAAAGADPASAAPNVMSLHMDLSGIRMPIVICGPSGVGKGTLISKLMQAHPDRFGFSVSHTTRDPRPGEVHGVHYYFTSTAVMAPQVEAGMFLEHAAVHGNMYGTSLAAVARVSAEGKHCVLDIDVQGAQQVRRSALGERCLFIFIAPPSHEELERRLRNRGTEAEDKVRQRLANAESEISKAQEPGLFHHILVNGDLDTAFAQLQQLIQQRVPGLLPELGSAMQLPAAAEQADASSAAANGTGGAGAAVAGIGAAAGMAATAAVGQPAAAEQVVSPLANGNGTQLPAPAVPSAPTATVVVGGGHGTSALLDFGFGAAAGPAVAVKGMPVRQYMDVTVIPVLREGLKALNVARPDDPLQYLADYLVAHKPAAAL